MTPPVLVGDIGATNVRLALLRPGERHGPRTSVAAGDHATLAAALAAGLAALGQRTAPRRATLALAGPVTGEAFRFTNRPSWTFSAPALARALSVERLTIVNDLAALALALPALGEGYTVPLGGPATPPDRTAPRAVIGAGTGVGVAALVRCAGGDDAPLAGEGGHVALAAGDDDQAEVLGRLRARGVRPSPDRLLSGPGLSLLYAAIAGTAVEAAPGPAEIAARSGSDATAAKALATFARWLGAFAGDVALMLGARGGVFIGGGVVAALGTAFATDSFRAGFEDKGRMRDYTAAISTRLVVAEEAALIGALAAAGRNGAGILTVAPDDAPLPL